MKFKKLVRFFGVLTVLWLTNGCESSTPPTSRPPEWGSSLAFGIIPIESEARTRERYEKFRQYLERTLGMKIEIVVPKDYAGVIDGLARKELHFALLGPKSYVEASRRANAQALARAIGEDGQDGYQGIIITQKGSGLKTLADLQGKTWAFTDPHSTSGHLIPSVYFAAQARIDPATYFSKVVFSGGHQQSILLVKNGEIDAAATNNLDLERDSGREWNQNDFHILWKSQLIPYDLLALRQDLPASLRDALRDAILHYQDADGLRDMAMSQLIPAQDSDYDFVRQLVEFKARIEQ